jgi:hypothetical protein
LRMVIDSQTVIPYLVLPFHNSSLLYRLFGKTLHKASTGAMIRTVSSGRAVMLRDPFDQS